MFRFNAKQAKLYLFFTSKQNKIFASILYFASETKTAAHPIANWHNSKEAKKADRPNFGRFCKERAKTGAEILKISFPPLILSNSRQIKEIFYSSQARRHR
jgi:hypothetical protein